MEEWKRIDEYNRLYKISSDGRLKRLGRVDSRGYAIKGLIINPKVNNRGYIRAVLHKDGQSKTISVHRLVATAFIPNPHNLPQVNHINEIKTDNRVENLEWVTHRQNQNHSANKRSTSKYSGVCWHKGNSSWSAHCGNNGKSNYLGYFKEEEDAAQAYICYCAIHNLK